MSHPIAIVTGATGDIGFAITHKLTSNNIFVIGLDVNKKKIEHYNSKKSLQNCIFYFCDIANYDQTINLIDSLTIKVGKPSILINCAGIIKDKSLINMTETDFDSVINVNLKGTFNCVKAVSKYFKEQNYGKIVNISSINALRGKFGQINYTTSKAGLHGLTKTAAIELGKYNVNVNAIAPGFILSSLTEQLTDDIKNKALQETVFKRAGTPSDVAELAYFLISDISRHITGEIIKIDGGQYL